MPLLNSYLDMTEIIQQWRLKPAFVDDDGDEDLYCESDKYEDASEYNENNTSTSYSCIINNHASGTVNW